MADKPTIYVATSSGVSVIDGVDYPFSAGVTRVATGHPLLRVGGVFFTPDLEAPPVYEVEAATAAPGETRTVTHPRKP